jgi:hypothetical protein
MRIRNLLFYFVILLFVVSCDKEEDLPTSLEILVKDDIGRVVSGASVKLYTSQTDWENGTNQFSQTQFSDASGKVKFSDLSPIRYYWFAQKDCYNNVGGGVTTTSPLQANVNSTTNAIISAKGSLVFQNVSSNPYRIFVNGQSIADLSGGGFLVVPNKPIGSYSLRVLQLSGYVLSPTDQSFTGTLNCGSSLTLSFPQ